MRLEWNDWVAKTRVGDAPKKKHEFQSLERLEKARPGLDHIKKHGTRVWNVELQE
jgi:hypothetical protein